MKKLFIAYTSGCYFYHKSRAEAICKVRKLHKDLFKTCANGWIGVADVSIVSDGDNTESTGQGVKYKGEILDTQFLDFHTLEMKNEVKGGEWIVHHDDWWLRWFI